MAVGDFSLEEKIVAITGGGSGICLAFSRLVAAQNNRTIIVDVALTPEAQAFIDEANETSKRVHFLECDVANWTDLQNIVTFSELEFGDVPDVYIAGAGVFEKPSTSFWANNEPHRYYLADVNLHPIKLTRIAMHALLDRNKKGVVIIVSSAVAMYPLYPIPLYNATKAALVAFTKSLRPADDEEGIKVACICPGYVETPLWTPDLQDQWSFDNGVLQTASTTAEAMMDLVQNGKYVGGTIMMSTKLHGNMVIDQEKYWERLASELERSSVPIRDILKTERGKGGE